MQQSLVKVIKNNVGRGASDLIVVLEIEGIFQGGMTNPDYTNENGKAYLHHAFKGQSNVNVNGKNAGKMEVPGQETFLCSIFTQ